MRRLPDQPSRWPWWAHGLHGAIGAYCSIWQGAHWELSTVPAHGPAILACNHVSVIDPLLLVASNPRPISFVVAQEYYEKRLFRPFLDMTGCIPVRRDRRDKAGLLKARALLREGRVLGLFPEGGINRGMEGSQLGIGWLVRETGAPVVPARIFHARQLQSDLRTWVARQHPRLRYGVPLQFHPTADAEEIVGAIMSAIATLG